MLTIHIYNTCQITFFNNLVSAYDLFVALSIPHAKQVFDDIKRQASDLFRETKRVRVEKADGEIQDRIFLNFRQIVVCLHLLKSKHLINDAQEWSFNLWYTDIIDRGIEYWLTEGKEERIQNQLILLAGYGNIKLRQEFTVLALPGSQEITRRYDIVQFINRTNTVRIRELKSRKITQADIEITLSQKGYLSIASSRWSTKRIEFIFSSLEGIEEEAQLLIDTIQGVSYEDVRDLGLRLYINALENTPLAGWYHFKSDVASKFWEVLPSQPLLRAAEDSLQRKMED